MLIKLPFDIWRDVFDWLLEKESKKRRKKRKKAGKGSIRKQLADKFNQLGDREFSELCQRWLHEWTKNVSIGNLSILRDYNSSACYLRKLRDYLHDFTDNHLPFAESELPANIQCFKEIRIGCMPDATALQFIRRMQPLFRNVHLQLDPFNYTQNTLQTTLTTLDLMLPLIDGIETVYINDSRFLLNLRDIFPGQFFGVKMLQVERTEVVFTGEMADLLLQWLYATRADGEPRKLILADYPENGSELRERIRQDFLNANCRVAFFICFYTYESKMENVQESITTNAGTNEQLVIRNSDYYYHLYIGRCPAELDGRAWTEEMRSKPFDEEKSIISITFQDTEAAAGEVPGP